MHIANQDGTSLQYSYEMGILSQIEHSNGTIRLVSVEGRIIQASSGKKKLNYCYDCLGLLTSVQDGEIARISYDYDEDLRLTSIHGPNKETLFSGSYDEYNRLVTYKWAVLNHQ